MTTVVNPRQLAPTVFVTAVGEAEGSRGAAAALACCGAEVDVAPLLVDVGGRAPRPTLVATAAAQQLEGRLKEHLTGARVAARGQVCHLAVAADPEGLAVAAAAATVVRQASVVIHLPPELLQEALALEGLRPSGVLLRADLEDDRPLVALAVRELVGRGLATVVLKRRLSWIAERRAHFGVLPPGSAGSLPAPFCRRLIATPR